MPPALSTHPFLPKMHRKRTLVATLEPPYSAQPGCKHSIMPCHFWPQILSHETTPFFEGMLPLHAVRLSLAWCLFPVASHRGLSQKSSGLGICLVLAPPSLHPDTWPESFANSFSWEISSAMSLGSTWQGSCGKQSGAGLVPGQRLGCAFFV